MHRLAGEWDPRLHNNRRRERSVGSSVISPSNGNNDTASTFGMSGKTGPGASRCISRPIPICVVLDMELLTESRWRLGQAGESGFTSVIHPYMPYVRCSPAFALGFTIRRPEVRFMAPTSPPTGPLWGP